MDTITVTLTPEDASRIFQALSQESRRLWRAENRCTRRDSRELMERAAMHAERLRDRFARLAPVEAVSR